jgi:hypothetical protein
VLQKETIRIQSGDGERAPTYDVTYVAELDEGALKNIVKRAHHARNGIMTEGPVRVRILKREKYDETHQ